MAALESFKVNNIDFVITYSKMRLSHMSQYDESNCKSIYKILKQIITSEGGVIKNITSSSINSKSEGGTHLVLTTIFEKKVNPEELQKYFNQKNIAGIEKITIAI